jgi:hypothetical protein
MERRTRLPFDTLFPEVARRELRAVQIVEHAKLPPGVYGFQENYCNDRDCDCRRVLLQVHWMEGRLEAATINYAFEPAKPPFDDEPQIFLDLLNPQSAHADDLLDLFKEMLESDPGYHQQLVRHYEMWKAVVDDPRHPDHAKVRGETHDDPDFSPAFPKSTTVRRNGPKVGPNQPCPCGSGKKYKKCCRG